MSAPTRQVLVAGTAGGVGTTTVTALLFARLRDRSGGAPTLFDHTAGRLGARLPEGDQARLVTEQLVLHDLGRHAQSVGVAALAEPACVLVVVSAATPVGCGLAAATLDEVRRSAGGDGLSRTVLVLAEVFGRHRLRSQVRALAAEPGPAGVVVLPADSALATGGRIPQSRLSPATGRSVEALLDLVLPGRRAQPVST